MGVIFDEVVTEIEPTAGSAGVGEAPRSETEGGETATSERELGRQIARLQERRQRLIAD